MDSKEAQMRAIKLSGAQSSGEAGAPMDKEGQVHKCPACGHEMGMDEVMATANANSERLTGADKKGLGGAHMDHEGREEKHEV